MDTVTQLKNAIEFAKKNPDSPQAIQLRRRIEGGMYQNELRQLQSPQEKKDGLIKTIAKDVTKTLVAKPAARATEAITRVVAPNSLAAQGFKEMQQTGESIDLPQLGISIEQQKTFDEGGAKQIAGEALKSASYLIPYGKVAGGVAGATGSKLAGNITAGATGGYTADVGVDLAEGKSIGESLKPGVGTIVGSAVPVAGAVARGTGRVLKKAGTKASEAVIPTSTREAGMLQTYKANNPFLKRVADVLSGTEKAPQTAGKTAVETKAGQTIPGLFGTQAQIGVQAKRASKSIWNKIISPQLDNAVVQVDLQTYFKKVEQVIVANNPEIGRQKSLLEALQAVREDYADKATATLPELQKLKEGWAQFVPQKFYNGKDIAGATGEVNALLADEARQTIYNTLGDDVKQAYIDYGNLQGLQELGKTAMTGQKLKGGAGSFVSEIFSRAVTPVGTIGGQVLYQAGKGILFVGEKGAKKVADVLGVKPSYYAGTLTKSAGSQEKRKNTK